MTRFCSRLNTAAAAQSPSQAARQPSKWAVNKPQTAVAAKGSVKSRNAERPTSRLIGSKKLHQELRPKATASVAPSQANTPMATRLIAGRTHNSRAGSPPPLSAKPARDKES